MKAEERGTRDSRREGGTLISTRARFYLLLGCAVPLWLADASRPPPRARARRRVASRSTSRPFAGVVVLGAWVTLSPVASVVGIHLGRCCWPGTRKWKAPPPPPRPCRLLLLLLRWLPPTGFPWSCLRLVGRGTLHGPGLLARGCVDTHTPEPPYTYCTYGLRRVQSSEVILVKTRQTLPASGVPYVPRTVAPQAPPR